ncbi:MAG TPA: aminotransferase class V-fold PLP-dependent enzyme, partial [Azospirillaceae bacterium]|nr:aminotransferase class V-fold PLP-dependent enzyme [Azospirillaceae bacterium]
MNQMTRTIAPTLGLPGGYDVHKVREDFPILSRTVYNHPLVYLDSAASAQKPKAVIEAMRRCMEEEYANVHRGVHYLSARTTDRFEQARECVRCFINARSSKEIVYTRGATEAVNLVAASWGRKFLKEGDEVVLTELEHHANIVPWQMLRAEKGIVLKVVPINDAGELMMEEFEKLLSERTRLVAVSHMSNALGTVNPIGTIIDMAHARGIPVLVDGCQAITHQPVDVTALDVD